MGLTDYYQGRRLSLKGQTCTVRYIGPVAGKAGDWLGVEWDDPGRGKHNGTHDNVKYFSCRTLTSTAGSFLRPSQPWDQPRTFFQAVHDKYIANESTSGADIVYLSGKQAEEIGFEKFAKRQAQLKGIHVLVLDRMCIRGDLDNEDAHDGEIAEMCARVTDLDLGGNLLETIDEIARICVKLPELRSLTLDGNRLSSVAPLRLDKVKALSISNLCSSWQDYAVLLEGCNSLQSLVAAESNLVLVENQLAPGVSSLDLSGNEIKSLSQLPALSGHDLLSKLILKHNKISTVSEPGNTRAGKPQFHAQLEDLDLSHNEISSWSFFDSLPPALPGLRHLRVTGNPLYRNLKSAEGKPLSSEDGYMLTIARLPQLVSLNYSKITDKERLNAETYYLSQIVTELSLSPLEEEPEILSRHTRWKALVEDYGEPTLVRRPNASDVDPNSLAARLVLCKFSLTSKGSSEWSPEYWEEEVPKSFDVYTLLGMVGRRLEVSTRRLRLTWVTGEKDPLAQKDGLDSPEWWDSDDEDENAPKSSELVEREVELAPGTRAIGTYFETGEAVIRVSLKA